MKQMISAAEVKTLVLSRKNFDESIIKDSIIEAAEQEYIKSILGKDLYDEIRTQYKADTLNADNKLLIDDYLKPALAHYAIYLCLPTMMVDICSAGLRINNTEFSTSVSSALRAEVAQTMIGLAQTFINKTVEFIEEQFDLGKYPLYDKVENVENDTSIIGGIILDDE